jgi:hypothetical protein
MNISMNILEGSMKSKMPSRPKTSGERAEIQLKANATRYQTHKKLLNYSFEGINALKYLNVHD